MSVITQRSPAGVRIKRYYSGYVILFPFVLGLRFTEVRKF